MSTITHICEEIDNLSLSLVMGDESNTNDLESALSILKNIESHIEACELPETISQKLKSLIGSLDNLEGKEKYACLKTIASSAQALVSELNNVEFDSNTTDSEEEHTPIVETVSVQESQTRVIDALYKTHQSLMEEIFEQFTAIQKLPDAPKNIPNELHQEVESYLLRLNQDALSIGSKPLIDIAQNLFTLMMQYPLTDIETELKQIGDFVLTVLEQTNQGVDASNITIPKEIAEVMSVIENKLSGKSTSPEAVTISSETVATTTHAGVDSYIIDADSDILSEFIAEAQDHLNAVEAVLLEKQLDFTHEDVDVLFRGVHSLKGTSSYFNLQEISASSHLLENILDEVRNGSRQFTADLKSLVLRYVDIENTLLKSAQEAVNNAGVMNRNPVVTQFISDIEAFFHNQPYGQNSTEQPMETVTTSQTEQVQMVEQPLEIIQNADTSKTQETTSKQNASNKDNAAAKSYVKIDTERLDSLGEMIGEMVIYSSMLIRKCRELLPNDESTMRMSDQVEKFSRELQDIGMSMRLDPIRGLFQKLSRLVWDTSKKLGKDVKFVVKGEDTELDRNVIERLADPLMHMVRNSLDHGIEDPKTRTALGKDHTGIIELSSSHEGGSIVIKIKDDGRGLDTKKLFNKAVEKGIISKDTTLTEQEIFQLIFAPGFSTAEKVTDISGRGVGMDVVRTNIESMRGRINIESKLGEGSTFSIELPLTLAIIEGIETIVGTEKFIFPMLSVVELVRPSESMIGSSMHTDETFFFRGKHLPLFRLSSIFSLPTDITSPSDGEIIILNNGGELVALLVDRILGNCQTVIKSLGPLFDKQGGIAGCAIVNNGDIGLIVDVRSLVQVAKMKTDGKRSTKNKIAQLVD